MLLTINDDEELATAMPTLKTKFYTPIL